MMVKEPPDEAEKEQTPLKSLEFGKIDSRCGRKVGLHVARAAQGGRSLAREHRGWKILQREASGLGRQGDWMKRVKKKKKTLFVTIQQ